MLGKAEGIRKFISHAILEAQDNHTQENEYSDIQRNAVIGYRKIISHAWATNERLSVTSSTASASPKVEQEHRSNATQQKVTTSITAKGWNSESGFPQNI